MKEYANLLPESLPPDVVCVIDDGQSLGTQRFQEPEFTSARESMTTRADNSDLPSLFEQHAAILAHQYLRAEYSVVWAAFADWVSMAADLRDVRLSGIPRLSDDERSALTKAVNGLLESDRDPLLANCRLEHVGDKGFLTSKSESHLQFNAPPPHDLIGQPLRDHPMHGLDVGLIKRIQTEIQMTLHAHPVNQARAANFEPLVSGLWLHGAGVAPGPVEMRLPPLRVNDPVWRAVWQHVGAEIRDDAAVGGTVVLASESADQAIESLDTGIVKAVLLIEADGVWRIRRQPLWRRWLSGLVGNRDG